MRQSGIANKLGISTAIGTLLLVLLSGCVRFIGELSVSSRDEVSGSVVVATASGLSNLFGDNPGLEALKTGYELVEGTRVAPYSEGGYSGIQVNFDDVPISSFSSAGAGLSPLRISRVGDLLVVEGDIDLSGGSDEPQSSSDVSTASFAEIAGGEQFLRIRFAGEVQQANGLIDADRHGVLWRLRLGEQNPIEAVVDQPEPGPIASWLTILILVVAIGLVAIVVVRFLASRGFRKTDSRFTDSEA